MPKVQHLIVASDWLRATTKRGGTCSFSSRLWWLCIVNLADWLYRGSAVIRWLLSKMLILHQVTVRQTDRQTHTRMCPPTPPSVQSLLWVLLWLESGRQMGCLGLWEGLGILVHGHCLSLMSFLGHGVSPLVKQSSASGILGPLTRQPQSG